MTPPFLLLETSTAIDQLSLHELTFEEALSKPYQGKLLISSPRSNKLQTKQLLAQSMTITIQLNDSKRIFHGICTAVEITSPNLRGYDFFTVTLSPWLSLTKLDYHCATFVDKNIIQVFISCCKRMGFHDYDTRQLGNQYPTQEFLLQYNESSFNFLHRILEENGISYYFHHQKSKHQMILIDSKTPKKTLNPKKIYYKNNQQHPGINHWQEIKALKSNRYILRHHNDQNQQNFSEKSCTLNQHTHITIGKQIFEHYDFIDNHISDAQQQQKLSQKILSDHCATHHYQGRSDHLHFSPYHIFEHAQKKENYYLHSVTHHATSNTHLMDNAQHSQQHYHNTFTCLASDSLFSPREVTPKPKMPGYYLATVKGVRSNQTQLDKQGRIKVVFPWQGKKYQSNWLRIMQTTASVQHGHFFSPRTGDEVIIAFVNEQTDSPIVIGCLYNGKRLPPYALPQQQYKSGIKSYCIHEQTLAQSNELQFNDTPQQECLRLTSYGDIKLSAFNGEELIANHNLQRVVNNNSTITTTKTICLRAKKAIHLATANAKITITADKISVKGKHISLNYA